MKIWSYFQKMRLLWLAFFDKRTPLAAKILVILGIIYGVSPIDLVPDIIPFFGQLDDIGVILSILFMFWTGTKVVRQKLHEEAPKKDY